MQINLSLFTRYFTLIFYFSNSKLKIMYFENLNKMVVKIGVFTIIRLTQQKGGSIHANTIPISWAYPWFKNEDKEELLWSNGGLYIDFAYRFWTYLLLPATIMPNAIKIATKADSFSITLFKSPLPSFILSFFNFWP